MIALVYYLELGNAPNVGLSVVMNALSTRTALPVLNVAVSDVETVANVIVKRRTIMKTKNGKALMKCLNYSIDTQANMMQTIAAFYDQVDSESFVRSSLYERKLEDLLVEFMRCKDKHADLMKTVSALVELESLIKTKDGGE